MVLMVHFLCALVHQYSTRILAKAFLRSHMAASFVSWYPWVCLRGRALLHSVLLEHSIYRMAQHGISPAVMELNVEHRAHLHEVAPFGRSYGV
mmetsp:Transcript_22215/g.61889  ORF Transcript_22215/g.61889 Transcript_22215/m.61889 type:complete len:93 (+) Transcript_22215:1271-1549(+)